MAPKRNCVAEIGGLQARNGSFRARVHASTGHQYGPMRSTREEALANLNAARTGAIHKDGVARHLAALAAAASELKATRRSKSTLPSSPSSACATAPAAEQRQPSLESCAAASAAAFAAKQCQQETITAASATKLAAEQLRPALSDDGEVFRRLHSRSMEQGLWPTTSLTTPACVPLQ